MAIETDRLISARPATSDEQQKTCVRLVREAAMMRRLYLDGLHRKFLVQPDVHKLAA